MRIPKSYIYTFLSGVALPVVIFGLLFFNGCFDSGVTPPSPVAESNEVDTLVVPADTITNTIYKDLIKYRTLFDTAYIHDTTETVKVASFDTSSKYRKKVIVSDNGKEHEFIDSGEVSVKGIYDQSFNRFYLNIGQPHSQRYTLPKESIFVKGKPIVELFAFGEFDLLRSNGWKIGILGQINISTITAYIAPNVNPEHVLSVPVGAKYLLLER